MFTLVHCIGDDDDDVAEALTTTCVVNTKLRRVAIIGSFLYLPVMKILATRQVPLEELEIDPPWVC